MSAAAVRDLRWYATQVLKINDDETREWRLVVVEAESPEDACRETGLADHDFRPATDDELARWDEITSGPLTAEEVEALRRLVRREQVNIFNKQRIRTERGQESGRGHDRFRARKSAVLRGKLETLLDDADDGEGDGPRRLYALAADERDLLLAALLLLQDSAAARRAAAALGDGDA